MTSKRWWMGVLMVGSMACLPARAYVIATNCVPPDRGTIEGGGSFSSGQVCTLTAIPKDGARFAAWMNGVRTNRLTFTVHTNASYTAYFSNLVYDVRTDVRPLGKGRVTGGGRYSWGSSCTLQAESSDGWQFVRWHDGLTNAARTLTVTGNSTNTAYFTNRECRLTVVSAHGAPVPSTGDHMVNWGTDMPCSAPSPDVHTSTQYLCAGWVLSGVSDTSGACTGPGTAVTLKLTNDAVLTWTWTTQYLWSASVLPRPTWPRLSPGFVQPTPGWYAAGATVAAQAVPNRGWTFVDWTGTFSSTSQSVTVTMDGAVAETAHFGKPDLAVTLGCATPSVPTAGGLRQAKVTVITSNIGTAPSPQTRTRVAIAFKADAGHMTGVVAGVGSTTNRVMALPPGGCVTNVQNLAFQPLPGTVSISAKADIDNSAAESNERNNASNLAVRVTGP